MSNMRLNNDVEEALGQGDGHCNTGPCSDGGSPAISSARTTHGAGRGEETRLSALRINHSEDEHYGMRHHDS